MHFFENEFELSNPPPFYDGSRCTYSWTFIWKFINSVASHSIPFALQFIFPQRRFSAEQFFSQSCSHHLLSGASFPSHWLSTPIAQIAFWAAAWHLHYNQRLTHYTTTDATQTASIRRNKREKRFQFTQIPLKKSFKKLKMKKKLIL